MQRVDPFHPTIDAARNSTDAKSSKRKMGTFQSVVPSLRKMRFGVRAPSAGEACQVRLGPCVLVKGLAALTGVMVSPI